MNRSEEEYELKELEVLSKAELSDLINLLKEYGRYMYEQLGLIAGRNTYNEQINNFPGTGYSKPDGAFYILYCNSKPAGCIGIRRFDQTRCEMKRMYVRPEFRGRGLGNILVQQVISTSRNLNYSAILLDTNIEMDQAIIIYKRTGFRQIDPYCINENNNPVFMELVI